MQEKTALQELIQWGDEMLKENPPKILSFAEVIDKAESLLHKEKTQIVKAWHDGNVLGRTGLHYVYDDGDQYYEKNYSNSEKSQ